VADSIYDLIALWLSVIFSAIGLVQLIAPHFVREAYRRWGYGRSVRLATGVLDIVAAVMLGFPTLRVWGIVLAAILSFGSIVVFLNHRQYRQAIPAIGLMLALIPATVAVPRPAQIQFVDGKASPQAGYQTVLAADDTVIGTIERD
jgi:DoxX-like family